MIERVVDAGRGRVARIRFSERADGDFRADACGADADKSVEHRRKAFMDGAWTWLRQVHGARSVQVRFPGEAAGAEADAAATSTLSAVLAVQTADCAPVVVVGGGSLGVAHAGWRGLARGVIGGLLEALDAVSPRPAKGEMRALLGPMIRPNRYEFGAAELAEVAAATAPDVAAVTEWGAVSLDLAAAARGALREAGVSEVEDLGFDSAHERFFSHRLRGDVARLATAARLEA